MAEAKSISDTNDDLVGLGTEIPRSLKIKLRTEVGRRDTSIAKAVAEAIELWLHAPQKEQAIPPSTTKQSGTTTPMNMLGFTPQLLQIKARAQEIARLVEEIRANGERHTDGGGLHTDKQVAMGKIEELEEEARRAMAEIEPPARTSRRDGEAVPRRSRKVR